MCTGSSSSDPASELQGIALFYQAAKVSRLALCLLTPDGHVYVWQTNSPHPVQVLAGHLEAVNNVAWNPVFSRRLFASCSDDSTVRIWQSPDAIETTLAAEHDDLAELPTPVHDVQETPPDIPSNGSAGADLMMSINL